MKHGDALDFRARVEGGHNGSAAPSITLQGRQHVAVFLLVLLVTPIIILPVEHDANLLITLPVVLDLELEHPARQTSVGVVVRQERADLLANNIDSRLCVGGVCVC